MSGELSVKKNIHRNSVPGAAGPNIFDRIAVAPYYENMNDLIERVGDYIDRHGLIEKNDRVLMSLSAGKDSMFLLHALRSIGRERGFETGIFHLNHMMRGADSDGDEEHLAECARACGMELFARRHDFTCDDHPGTSFEEHARNVRYRTASDIASAHGFNRIATGHTLDDSVETILMRVFGGTGIHGLQGIPPRRGAIIRPLLSITAAEIYGFLEEHGIAWREDASNSDVSYARNFIRQRVLPLAREMFPMIANSVRSLGEVAADTISLLDRLLLEKYGDPVQAVGEVVHIDADILMNDYPAFCHIVSRTMRERFGHAVNRAMLDELYGKYDIPRANVHIYSDSKINVEKIFREGKSRLAISPCAQQASRHTAWEYRVDLENFREAQLDLREIGISVTVRLVEYGYFEKYFKNSGYVFIAVENNDETIYIRNRRDGDRIRTANGTKKIKDLMIEMKLDASSKDRVPLIAAGDAVAACMPGFLLDAPNRVSSDFLVDKNSKKVIAVIKNRL